jgi:hypothetical protein
MSKQFNQNVFDFQIEVFKLMLEKFEGKVVGSEDMNLEVLKEHFFEGFTPGKKTKKTIGATVKKPRALSGYTFFGQQMKETFNQDMEKLEVKPKYVEYLSQKWKALSSEEQNEWKEKAKETFEKEQNAKTIM